MNDVNGVERFGSGQNLIRQRLRRCHLPLKGKAFGGARLGGKGGDEMERLEIGEVG